MPTQARYAVIFISQRTAQDQHGYDSMSARMLEMVKNAEGFINVDSLRDSSGLGITISYWTSLESIKKWKSETEHLQAQKNGKAIWYSSYTTKICRIEDEYSFSTSF